jgi:hypothetical protein
MKIHVELDSFERDRLNILASELGYFCLHDYLFDILWRGMMAELEMHGFAEAIWDEEDDPGKDSTSVALDYDDGIPW